MKYPVTNMKRKSLVMLGSLTLALAVHAATAQDASDLSDDEMFKRMLPELNEKPNPAQRSGATGMSCFVDTPAFDLFTSPLCVSAGTTLTTTAVFRVDNPPADFTIIWSDSSCSSSSTVCVVPINIIGYLTVSATVLNNANYTFTKVSATARYEGLF
ncbi:MAG: hypothetical protein LC637_00430 [Xanthomonadaceae bacterium]|nr:hypothetical protein [Xanthomonadaceae bacterium]